MSKNDSVSASTDFERGTPVRDARDVWTCLLCGNEEPTREDHHEHCEEEHAL